MLKLHQFEHHPKCINYSPYCLKLETFLKMAEVPYEVVAGFDTRKAPKKKYPFVEIDGQRMGDSTLIIEHLSKKLGKDLDAKLSPLEKAQSRAFRRMLEEASIYPFLYFRWVDDRAWAKLKATAFARLPAPLRWFIPEKIRTAVSKKITIQGTGRHSRAEILEMAKADIKAISDFLGDKAFFFGAEPTLIDATAFGFLNNIVNDPFESELTTYGKTLPNLARYCERMRTKYFA